MECENSLEDRLYNSATFTRKHKLASPRPTNKWSKNLQLVNVSGNKTVKKFEIPLIKQGKRGKNANN